MMLQVGDDGVVSSVDEEELVYADKKELEQFIESYKQLEKENEQLKQENKVFKELLDEMSDCNNEIWLDNGQIIRLKKVFEGEWR